MTPQSVSIRHAYLAYDNQILFEDLNLTLTPGKCTCLLGPSGVGKSALLRMIARLTPLSTEFQGEISCDSEQIAYMAQTDLLMPWLTALENACLSARLHNTLTEEFINRAKNLLTQLGLQNALNKYPNELSGGMRQRVALARTLLQDKSIVLMDEPFSALDTATRLQLQTIAANVLQNRTVLLVTHDPIEALRLAHEIYILSGRPATLSAPIQLITPAPRDPADPEVIIHQAELFHALMRAKEISE